MADQFGPKRPFGITIVAVLAILSGAFDVIGGIALLAAQGDAELAAAVGGSGMVVTLAIVSIVLGAAILVIAFGLLRGNAVARIAATVVQVFSLAMSIWVGIAQPSSLGTEIPSALLAIAVLVLLWSGEASRYFRGLAPDEPAS
jgi:hypothetical protein